MDNLIFIGMYTIFTYSLSNLIAFSDGPFDLFYNFRMLMNKISPKLYELVTCMMCLPTYVGLFLSIFNIFVYPNLCLTPITLFYGYELHCVLHILGDAIITSGVVWLVHTIQYKLEK